MRPFQFHLKEHWRYPQSLDSLLPWTEAISAHLDWWQNPSNVVRGADLHPKDHSIQLFTDTSNKGWGADLDQVLQGSVIRSGKKATHKHSRIEGGLPGPSTGLTAYAYHPITLLHRVIQKIRQYYCLIIVIAPGWPGMPWFWDIVQLSTTTTSSVNNSS